MGDPMSSSPLTLLVSSSIRLVVEVDETSPATEAASSICGIPMVYEVMWLLAAGEESVELGIERVPGTRPLALIVLTRFGGRSGNDSGPKTRRLLVASSQSSTPI